MAAINRQADGRAYVRVNPRVAAIIAGEVDVTEWDDEELLRGYQRAKDGSFSGRPPSVVPRGVYEEFIRRQFDRIEHSFATNVAAAAERLAEIATDPNVDESVQLRAIDMLLTRVMGKPKETVQISGASAEDTPAWQQVIEAVTIRRDIPELGDGDVVDAEVLGEEYVDDEWVFTNE